MWNSGRASGKSVKAKGINNRLDEILAMALGVYTELSAVRDGMTTGDVKSLLLGMAGGQVTLLSYFRTFIENFAKRVGVNGLKAVYTQAFCTVTCGFCRKSTCLLPTTAHGGSETRAGKPELSLKYPCWICRYASWRNTGTWHWTAGCCPCIPTVR